MHFVDLFFYHLCIESAIAVKQLYVDHIHKTALSRKASESRHVFFRQLHIPALGSASYRKDYRYVLGDQVYVVEQLYRIQVEFLLLQLFLKVRHCTKIFVRAPLYHITTHSFFISAGSVETTGIAILGLPGCRYISLIFSVFIVMSPFLPAQGLILPFLTVF